jgi:hypothetical protein
MALYNRINIFGATPLFSAGSFMNISHVDKLEDQKYQLYELIDILRHTQNTSIRRLKAIAGSEPSQVSVFCHFVYRRHTNN